MITSPALTAVEVPASTPLTDTISLTVASVAVVGFSTVQEVQVPTEVVTTLAILVTPDGIGVMTLTVYSFSTDAAAPTVTLWVQAAPANAPELQDQPWPVPL